MDEYLNIGENLKRIRSGMGLSLDAVASMTGVSKTMLSQIERAESVPTLATVSKIANGLKLRFDSLLSDNDKDEYEILNIKNLKPVIDDDGKTVFYTIFPFTPASGFEIFYCVFKPGCHHISETHPNGKTEYVLVIDGTLELVVESESYILEKGAAFSFHADKKHEYINNSNKDVKVHFVLSYN